MVCRLNAGRPTGLQRALMLGDPQKSVELLGSYQGHDESSCLEATRTSKSPLKHELILRSTFPWSSF